MSGGDVNAIAAVICGVLFATAAIAKLLAWERWSALVSAVIPQPRSARAAKVAVPLAEVAVACLSPVAPALGFGAAALLLASFAIAVGSRLDQIRGRECNCFGSLLPMRIDRGLVIRNVVLAALAAFVAVASALGTSQRPGVLELVVSVSVLGAAVGILAWRRDPSNGRGGPSVGERVSVPGVGRRRPALVALLSPGCPACEEIAPALARLDDAGGRLAVIAAIGPAPDHEREALATKAGTRARLDLEWLWRDWRVHGTPLVVAIEERGRVLAAELGAREGRLDELGRAALADRDDSALAQGTAATQDPGADPRGTRITRRRALRQALASAGALLALPLLPRLALAQGGGDPNVVEGNCDALLKHMKKVGVTCPAGSPADSPCPAGKELPEIPGVTWWERPIPATQSDRQDRLTGQGVLCPTCATATGSSPGRCFPTARDCASGCRAPIGSCSGTCSQRCGDVCIDTDVKLALTPNFQVATIRWKPKSDKKKCKKAAKSFNQQLRAHEQIHVDHDRQLTDDANRSLPRHFRCCAPTEAEARACIDRQIADAIDNAQAGLTRKMENDADRYDFTPAGLSDTKLNCPDGC